MLRVFLVVCSLFWVSTVHAQWNKNWDMQAEAISNYFDFNEMDAGNSRVHEHGALFGFSLGAKKFIAGQHWYTGLDYSQYGGLVNYEGFANNGEQTHQTNSMESIFDTRLTLGRQINNWQSPDSLSLFTSVGFYYWMRDIKTRDRKLGPLETYQWFYLQAGAQGLIARFHRWHLLTELAISRSFQPRMQVNFKSANYKDRVLEPGSHYGVELALPLEYRNRKNLKFSIRSYVRFWELGQSPSVLLLDKNGYPRDSSGGASYEYHYEPHSTTLIWGLNLGIEKRF